MNKSILTALLAGALSSPIAAVSFAGPIDSRAELQKLLGGAGTLETFEAFKVGEKSATPLDCSPLNSTAKCNGQTSLVVPGVSFTFVDSVQGKGQWNGKDYFGSLSREILSNEIQSLVIDFTTPVQAFGVDLRAFTNNPATAVIQILDADDKNEIGVISGKELLSDGKPQFVGWLDGGGIGGVVLRQTGPLWSPIIDNLEFGSFRANGVPEPSALSLLAVAFAGLVVGRLSKRARQ